MALSVPLRPASHQRAAQRTPRAHAAATLRVPLVAVHGHRSNAPILRLPRESQTPLIGKIFPVPRRFVWEKEHRRNLVLVDELELGIVSDHSRISRRIGKEHAFERASHRLDGED